MIPNIDFIKEMLKGIKSFIEEIRNEVETSINSKQNALTFDNTPIDGSVNPVTSEGIKSYVDNAHVQSDLSQTDESAKNYVKGIIRKESLPEGYPYKEHVTTTVNMPLNITWDGDTTGLKYANYYPYTYFKVSDKILTNEQIKASTLSHSTGATISVNEKWDDMVQKGNVTNDYVIVGDSAVVIRRAGVKPQAINPNPATENLIFTETGVYFVRYGSTNYLSGLSTFETWNKLETVIKPIAEEFLPESAIAQEVIISDTEPTDETAEIWINTSEEWNDNIAGGASSWNDLTDKPFDENNIINKESLPEGYPYKEEPAVILAEGACTLNPDDMTGPSAQKAIEVGQKYKVMWDGEAYEVEAEESMYGSSLPAVKSMLRVGSAGRGILYIDDGANPAFCCAMTTASADAGKATAVVSISELSGTIHPMAPEFLPAGVPHVAKAFADIVFDGNADGKDVIQFNEEYTFVKVSDKMPTLEQLHPCYLTVHGVDNLTGEETVTAAAHSGTGCTVVGELFAIVAYETECEADGMSFSFPSTGIYVLCVPTADMYVSKIVNIGTAIPVPEECLPIGYPQIINFTYVNDNVYSSDTSSQEVVKLLQKGPVFARRGDTLLPCVNAYDECALFMEAAVVDNALSVSFHELYYGETHKYTLTTT